MTKNKTKCLINVITSYYGFVITPLLSYPQYNLEMLLHLKNTDQCILELSWTYLFQKEWVITHWILIRILFLSHQTHMQLRWYSDNGWQWGHWTIREAKTLIIWIPCFGFPCSFAGNLTGVISSWTKRKCKAILARQSAMNCKFIFPAFFVTIDRIIRNRTWVF